MASLNAGPSCPGAHYSLSGWITDLLWFPLTQQPTASSLPEAYTSEELPFHINMKMCCPEMLSAPKWPWKNSPS